MGAPVLQRAVARQVVIAVPLNVYPVLHAYVEMEPVEPVVGETLPNVGFDNVAVHALAAILLLMRTDKHSTLK